MEFEGLKRLLFTTTTVPLFCSELIYLETDFEIYLEESVFNVSFVFSSSFKLPVGSEGPVPRRWKSGYRESCSGILPVSSPAAKEIHRFGCTYVRQFT